MVFLYKTYFATVANSSWPVASMTAYVEYRLAQVLKGTDKKYIFFITFRFSYFGRAAWSEGQIKLQSGPNFPRSFLQSLQSIRSTTYKSNCEERSDEQTCHPALPWLVLPVTVGQSLTNKLRLFDVQKKTFCFLEGAYQYFVLGAMVI